MSVMETTIGEAFKLRSGKFLSAKNIIEGKYPVYGGNGINGFHHEYIFKEKKVVIGRVGAHCGNVHISEPCSWITDNALFIHKKHYDYDDRYLLHLLRHLKLNQYSSQSGQPLISEGRLKDIRIPLPPLEEQKKIAAILDAADTLRQKDKALIAKYEELTQSLFLDMFGDPVSNSKGWEKVTFGKVLKSVKYGTNEKGFDTCMDGMLPVLRIPNIVKGEVVYDDLKYCKVSEKEKENLLLEKGDLLFVRSNGNPNYIGKCAMFNDSSETIYASYLIRARLKDDSILEPSFVSFIFSLPSFRREIVKLARTTAGNFNLNTQGLKGLSIIAPKGLQNQFTERIQQIEQQKQLAQQSLQKSEELFNSLLQRAFKGELTKTLEPA